MEKEIILGTSSSSSLRRKSFVLQSTLSPKLVENNDEAERLARRHELNASTASVENLSTNKKRRSLGLGFLAHMPTHEIKDRMAECIKLNIENKINVKNAFSLEIIDFMSYMIKKQDANISNLQAASTSLDVSTKIYGFRVDGVYTEIMKIASGIDKQQNDSSIDEVNGELNTEEGDQVKDIRIHKKKGKKKNKQKIFSTTDSLKGTVEIMKPSLWIMENEDSQTTDALYQVMLSNHANSNYSLHLYHDVIVDVVEQKIDKKDAKIIIPQMEDFSKLEICPPLTNFEFQNWINDIEKETGEGEEEDKGIKSKSDNESGFQFDLDASLPSEEEVPHDDMNYLDIQDDVENTEKCAEVQKPTEKIVDLCKVLSNVGVIKTSEYSFLQKSVNIHWAGPSHWRISNFSKLSGSKIIAACPQKPGRKRKEIEICYDDSIKTTVVPKFVVSKVTKFDAANLEWYEEILTLPRDMHYDIASAAKLYFHELIHINMKKDQLDATHVSDIENYNYDNENDISNYCPYVSNEDYALNEDNNDLENNDEVENDEAEAQMIFTGDNLVAIPKLTNKISIAYSTRAKRIDMRQLKKSIWKSLTMCNDTENIENREKENRMKENRCFSEVCKTLPNLLTKANIEVLSFPISFVSLLHLANEKTLKIQSVPDMSDLIIEAS
ncbi:condensin complex subunit 2-like [Bombus huntii]|uniref:condensin complex subunit 2-like n=1 Tax=Bombus huntii TaxID=85661 RepID=UPI0021A99737|nr:condensin complex subunit 2-like [Bombus huntii]